jgi:hypothetical protein
MLLQCGIDPFVVGGGGGSGGSTGGSGGTSVGDGGPGGSGGSSGGGGACLQADAQACVSCCEDTHATGYSELETIIYSCACNGPCMTDCAGTYDCGGTAIVSSSCTACVTASSQRGGACVNAMNAMCPGQPACAAFRACLKMCTSDGGGGGSGGSPPPPSVGCHKSGGTACGGSVTTCDYYSTTGTCTGGYQPGSCPSSGLTGCCVDKTGSGTFADPATCYYPVVDSGACGFGCGGSTPTWQTKAP